jgi:predicted RNA-binding Zn ribbon-like protein
MNLLYGLERIEERLVDNGARNETLSLVDTIRRTASRPGGDQAQVRSLVELVRRLMRTPVANANVGVYDDLAVLEEQLVEASAKASAEREAVESRPLPKSKKYYRALKEKEDKSKR